MTIILRVTTTLLLLFTLSACGNSGGCQKTFWSDKCQDQPIKK